MTHHRLACTRQSTTLVLALVAGLWFPNVRAQHSDIWETHGTDAPGDPPAKAGNNADNAAGASGHHGGLGQRERIIIGVVVGGVAFLAIIGGIVYLIRKKRRLDRLAKRYENIHSYYSRQQDLGMSLRSHPQHDGSDDRAQAENLDLEKNEEGEEDITAAEARTTVNNHQPVEQIHAKYDPSTFARQNNNVDSRRSREHPSSDMRQQRYRNSQGATSRSRSGAVPPPPHPPPPSLQRAPSPAGSVPRARQDEADAVGGEPSSAQASPAPMLRKPSFLSRGMGPKKPKPVLAKLITNLN